MVTGLAVRTSDLKQSYFQLFDLNLDFNIDLQALRCKQQQLQSQFHPDRYVNASDADKLFSVQMASRVNDAFETLSNPAKRARYMLEASHQHLTDESKTTADIGFLQQQVELREQMESCRCSTDPIACCDQILTRIKELKQSYELEFVESFNAGELLTAEHSSRRIQFIQRVHEQVLDLQIELEEKLG